MAEMRYAVNSQSFEEIRRDGFYYIDKTDMVFEMTHKLKSVFLSRPRRFGKTLLTQTLESYFSGQKELFEGLAIEKLESDWKQYPVLHFDLSGMKLGTVEQVNDQISYSLGKLEEQYGVVSDSKDLGIRFANLIEAAQNQYGLPAVIIIDEYDAPILDAYGKDSVEGIRDVLMTFFTPLKKFEKNLRFVFLTGVTKFSSLSIFSSLNMLTDISLLPEYNSLCGFTDKEIVDTFAEGIARLAERYGFSPQEMRERLRTEYDGYRFSGKDERIYNPFSVVNSLGNSMIRSYWFGSGTPTFLTKVLRTSNIGPSDLEDQTMGEIDFDTPVEPIAGEINPTALLYQSGYFTIKDYDFRRNLYLLGIPNHEVREGLMNQLLPYYTGNSGITREARRTLADLGIAIEEGDTDSMRDLLTKFFDVIPYSNTVLPEDHYKTILYVLFSMTSQFVSSETRSSRGRMDICLFNGRNIYILEIKLDKSADEAISQINWQRYAERFGMTGKPVVKIGVNFDSTVHNITEWEVE